MSLEWVWRFSKLSPNSLQTRSKLYLFIFFGFLLTLFWKKRLWANSLQTLCKLVLFSGFFSCPVFLGKNEFWVPNSEQTHSKLGPIIVYVCSFSLLLVQIVVLKICLSLEKAWGFSNILFGDEQWIWSDFGNYSTSPQPVSKLIRSPSQTPMVSFFVFV